MADLDEYPRQQIFVHPEKPTAEKFEPVENDLERGGVFKPSGGLWTSSYQDGTCGWLEWMRGEQWFMHADSDVWRLTVTDDPDLCVIDSNTDAKALLEVYSVSEGPLAALPTASLDYEAMADDYDGIWMTSKGLAETRFDYETHAFYGWDCECTLWLDWCFEGDPERLDIDIKQ